MAFFSTEKRKNAVFASLHFQSLAVIQNGGTSLCRAATSIFEAPLSRYPMAEEEASTDAIIE
jgi:hypothetical protein